MGSGGEDKACPRGVTISGFELDRLGTGGFEDAHILQGNDFFSGVQLQISGNATWNSMSLLAKGPTVMNASILSCLGVTVWCHMCGCMEGRSVGRDLEGTAHP